MIDDDRERIMCADDYPVALSDGLMVNLVDDFDTFELAGEDEAGNEGTIFLGVVVTDPSGEHLASLWGIGMPDYWSGHNVRDQLCSYYVPDVLSEARAMFATETSERDHWAARDTVTI